MAWENQQLKTALGPQVAWGLFRTVFTCISQKKLKKEMEIDQQELENDPPFRGGEVGKAKSLDSPTWRKSVSS